MAVSKARTSAGTKLHVSTAAPATYDKAGFIAVVAGSWKEVGEITDLGSFGKKYNLVSHNPLGDRKTIKRRGSYNNGTLSLKYAAVPTDEGQVILDAAGDASLYFKVTTQSGSKYYFSGQVMGTTLEIGSVDQIMAGSCDIEIDDDIIPDTLVA
jgi:hypothetical protein